MAPQLILLCTLIYVGVSIENARAKDWPMSLVFAAYAIANVGLIWQSMRGRPWTDLWPF
jgi:hypothetical protein